MNRNIAIFGLARKAGKLSYGYDAVKSSIVTKKSKLVVVAFDVSEKSLNRVRRYALDTSIKILKVRMSMDELGVIFGKKVGFISINDIGFAKKIVELEDTNL